MMPPLLLLAAGGSARMGSPKGLLPFRGRPWLLSQLEPFARAGGSEAVVVLGEHAPLYFEKIPGLREGSAVPGLRLSLVRNPHPERGAFHSLQCGLDGRPFPDGFFVLPVDVPVLSAELWKLLARPAGSVLCKRPIRGAQLMRGHPVWISGPFAERLGSLPWDRPDSRLDRQIAALAKEELSEIETDCLCPEIFRDFDTPEEWQHFLGSQARGGG